MSCRRSSRFWGLGCPKIFHEIEDSLELLAKLAGDKNWRVRSSVATNPNTSPETLKVLAGDEDWRVRETVAKNSVCPSELLGCLARDGNGDVCVAVARNINTPTELLKVLAGYAFRGVRSKVAQHPACPQELLTKLARDESREVRAAAATNPNTPPEALYVDTIETPEGDSISGATCHLQEMSMILINRNEPEARRFFDLAHELFHALTWDAMKSDHRESNSVEDWAKGKRIERLANNFAAALLMPQASLANLIDKRRIDDVSHLADVAMQLRVAPVALAWRLFNLNWIGTETRDALQQERQRPSVAGTPKRFSPAFVNMLHRAIGRGHLSARKAAKAMGATLTQLVGLFSEHSLSSPFEL